MQQGHPTQPLGDTPWFSLLTEHCESRGGYVELDVFGQETDDHGNLIEPGTFVITAYRGGGRTKGQARSRRLELAAKRVCHDFDLHFSEAA
jgi:hypothetical protein